MKTNIIPHRQVFGNTGNENSLNLKAICIFAAAGFFLEKDTYYNNLEALQPATDYSFNENGFLENSKKYWSWNYSPREISFKQATEEFAHLFENITNENLKGKNVILPLSGGLDSRTQAAGLNKGMNVKAYSYKFQNSFDETKYGKEICKKKGIPFDEFIIPRGYLWNIINELSEINQCYADFTHPRQMAVIEKIKKLGNVFYLGHWGDVLFDDMGVEDDITFDVQVDVLVKKILKRGGKELAEALWKQWDLKDNFESYFRNRISDLLREIKIDNANSGIRAFKSMYWAPRWTSANMNVFSDCHPVVLPYYDDAMSKFICTVPENYLSGRQIQIEYIKMKDPSLAEIPWQTYDPLNLYNYKRYNSKTRIPYRILKKVKREIKNKLSGSKLTTRNWEIQFIGEENDKELRKHLFENKNLNELIPEKIIKEFYDKFKNTDSVYYSHPVSMLLTLSLFTKNIYKEKEDQIR